ncbi:MAG: cupin domain-containing protein [Gemmatimonadetes bacterium]|nr:cupin domain-containing protein [Gemmatimonadota bacterium]
MATMKRWDPATGPLQLTTLRQCLEREGMITAWWSDVPGTHIHEHAHHFPETRWVLSGYLRVTARGEVIDLGPGDRLDLPAGTPHSSEVLGLSPVVYVTGTTERTVEPAGVHR